MCINPIQIYNRSSRISYRGQALLYTVPCGQCEECKKSKTNEYILRSYIQYKDTLTNKGFVYFDTLTYSNKYLPKHFGIAHFSRKDITLFLKELRIYLTRAGFNVKDNIKYFVTSEYGGKKHRPHYHVLFFITVPNLTVDTFWYYLNKAWKFGFIDRRSTAPTRVVNSQAALNYVAKYVQKDQEWQSVVDAKLARLKRIGADAKLLQNLKDYQPFHRQSQGYGENFLKYINLNSLLQNGFVTIPDRQYVIKNYALPMYYKRKLFYYCIKEDNKYRWILNDFGKRFKVNQLDNVIKSTASKYRTIINNLSNYNIRNDFDFSVTTNLINKYLDGRTLEDFATYVLVYRNKMWSSRKPLPTPSEFYRLSLDEGTTASRLYDESTAIRSSYRNQLQQYQITQFRFPQFKNFDNLFLLFRAITNYISLEAEAQPKRVQQVRDRLKLLLDAV